MHAIAKYSSSMLIKPQNRILFAPIFALLLTKSNFLFQESSIMPSAIVRFEKNARFISYVVWDWK